LSIKNINIQIEISMKNCTIIIKMAYHYLYSIHPHSLSFE
jgi:hypothetical protein